MDLQTLQMAQSLRHFIGFTRCKVYFLSIFGCFLTYDTPISTLQTAHTTLSHRAVLLPNDAAPAVTAALTQRLAAAVATSATHAPPGLRHRLERGRGAAHGGRGRLAC